MAELKVWFEPIASIGGPDIQLLGWRLSVVLAGPPPDTSLFTERKMMWVKERWPWL